MNNGRFAPGHSVTEEIRAKMRAAKVGKPSWNAGTARPKQPSIARTVAIDKLCPVCGVAFTVAPAAAAHGKGKVCSNACRRAWFARKRAERGDYCKPAKVPGAKRTPWNKGMALPPEKRGGRRPSVGLATCEVCKGRFYVRPSQVGVRRYCSKPCYFKVAVFVFKPGPAHPAWVDGQARNGYTPEFSPALKKRIRARDNYACQLCGVTEEQYKAKYNRSLCVNHIDFNKKNCDPENLNTLCNGCNTKINWNRLYWAAHFQAIVQARKLSNFSGF